MINQEDYDSVLALIGWDRDGKLRIAEDSEWEEDIEWMGEPMNVRLHLPKARHPNRREKGRVLDVYLHGPGAPEVKTEE